MPEPFRPIAVLGTGSALPERVLTSGGIDARIGRPPGWTERRVGVALGGLAFVA